MSKYDNDCIGIEHVPSNILAEWFTNNALISFDEYEKLMDAHIPDNKMPYEEFYGTLNADQKADLFMN
jgi:hypothetical protein